MADRQTQGLHADRAVPERPDRTLRRRIMVPATVVALCAVLFGLPMWTVLFGGRSGRRWFGCSARHW